MSYHAERDQVVLTMSVEDYERLLAVFAIATSASLNGRGILSLNNILALLNRVNEGNPQYTPYQIPGEPEHPTPSWIGKLNMPGPKSE